MSDKRKYMLNYFWSMADFLSMFLSVFIIIPRITGSVSAQVYGVYTMVIGFTMFLSYADFGFLGAAYKYGCDEYLKGNKKTETKILSSVSFIQLVSFSIFAAIMVYLSKYPGIIISGLTQETREITGKLFLLLAIFSFTYVPRRIIVMVSQFRIEAYRVMPWYLLTNLSNVILVFLIFNSSKGENIVYYYLCSSIISFIVTMILGAYLFKKWKYSLKYFLSNLKFNSAILNSLWPFARASIFGSIMFLLFFEVDSIYVGKFLSAEKLAFYSIGITLMTFFRRLNSILMGPYMPKYNKYAVAGDDAAMKNFYYSSVSVTAPFIFIPATVSILLMPQFITSWVGPKYFESILVAQILIISFMLSPVMDFPSYIITAKARLKLLYISSALTVLVFYSIVILLGARFGINIIAAAKSIASWIAGIYMIYAAHKIIKVDFREYSGKVLAPIFFTMLLCIILCVPFTAMSAEKSKIAFLKILAIDGAVSFVALIFYVYISKQFRVSIGQDYFSHNKLKEKIAVRVERIKEGLRGA